MSHLFFRMTTLPLLLALLLMSPFLHAQDHALGSSRHEVGRQPLQELVKQKRSEGLIYVAIPLASVYGDGAGYRPYCSPHIRASNESNKTVVHMLAGIRYQTLSGKDAGSTITRFSRVKVGQQETHYFHSTIKADDCSGLTGALEVVSCTYEDGTDCSDDVRTVAYGAVPLRMFTKPKEAKE